MMSDFPKLGSGLRKSQQFHRPGKIALSNEFCLILLLFDLYETNRQELIIPQYCTATKKSNLPIDYAQQIIAAKHTTYIILLYPYKPFPAGARQLELMTCKYVAFRYAKNKLRGRNVRYTISKYTETIKLLSSSSKYFSNVFK